MPLIAGFYVSCHAAVPDSPAVAGSLFSGVLMGYIFYDCIHHFAHDRKLRRPWLVRFRCLACGHAADWQAPGGAIPTTPSSLRGCNRNRDVFIWWLSGTCRLGYSGGTWGITTGTVRRTLGFRRRCLTSCSGRSRQSRG